MTLEPRHFTVVTAPGCHLCEDARAVLDQLADTYPLEIALVDARSDAGRRLLRTHRVAMNPLVLVDGAFFSSGRLPRGKLRALLDPATCGAGHG